ncbi:hypothetical protein UFOVP49_75 [uncultured Caudovirales phage]|uniref:Uncharacterized protein n=1 Tax=uncultured Caudovirales phage TaxID=2100421 RepID=A0A6J5KTL9_9CAUD|nr:hypothetical protein UFOVP49_75 [uncultured Caudovirales phage]
MGFYILIGCVIVGVLYIFIYRKATSVEPNDVVGFDSTVDLPEEEEEEVSPPPADIDPEDVIEVAGSVRRMREGSEFFIVDPIDDRKVWVNPEHTLYNGARGILWEIVD